MEKMMTPIEELDDCDKDEKVESMMHTVNGSSMPKSKELLEENGGNLKPAARDIFSCTSFSSFLCCHNDIVFRRVNIKN
eukprot:5355137-Ditylum_brightwellii.AAC.1